MERNRNTNEDSKQMMGGSFQQNILNNNSI